MASAEAGLNAIRKGATIVQLRAPDLTARQLEAEANALVPKASVPVVVSSRCDVALAAGAAGVNLPERDIRVAEARTLMGQRLVGRSVHSIESAVAAEREGADYVIFGPVWPSPSHPEEKPQGIQALAEVACAVRIPVLAIGGVTSERVEECARAGAAGYAAITLFR
ncbi:MAG TPA: thiamine phosphate synthase [Candidatus Polarisedimenticolia bacterium]|nr:thiamine phosphate synthase [Candidatus Polarisedimenticolia bacterium]